MTGNDACGMQVHVSQGEGKWELKDLQAMSHNIIYFECAIDALPQWLDETPRLLHGIAGVLGLHQWM
ncbi:hypothetical protein N7444_013913 [Penicillium canescens]|nr:hypothetical protein N7444_013913 [Penicillium canescens]